nr:MAG TPA: hypothetical protein [Caudoviricetes sp.]
MASEQGRDTRVHGEAPRTAAERGHVHHRPSGNVRTPQGRFHPGIHRTIDLIQRK